jgi:hypothetical protein
MTYIIPLVLSRGGIIPNKLHGNLKLLARSPGLNILKQKAVKLNT